MKISFYMTNVIKLYARSYIKLTTIFAELGGFMKLTILIFSIISTPFFNKKVNLKIINEFFELYDDIDPIKKTFNHNHDLKNIDLKRENIRIEEKLDEKNMKINDNNELFKGNSKNYVKSNDIINIPINNNNNHSNIPNKKISSDSDRSGFSLMSIKKEDHKDSNKSQNEVKIKRDFQIIKALKKKTKFTNTEIFRSSYYMMCFNNELKNKNSNYLLANKNIHKGTDYLEIIKLNRDFKVLKFLLLNDVQQKTMTFTSNLKINQDSFYDNKEYSEILDSKMDIFETIKKINNYFNTRAKADQVTKIDERIFYIIHPKIKKIFNELEE